MTDPVPLASATVHDFSDRRSPLQSALPRRFIGDMPDKGLFGLAAIGGFAAICGLKLHGYDPDLIAILSVGVMIGYGAIAFYMPRMQTRLDRLGDNFYYLGFIYTLASLSVALLQLRSGGAQIEHLLGSFGIALATTIVGIAGRVLFVQLRSDIDEVEDRTRRDLAAASAELRAQLASSVREFETMRTAFTQTLSETTSECSKAASRQIGEIEAMTRRSAELIGGAFEANRTQCEKQNQAMETVAKAVERASLAAFEANRMQCERVNEATNSMAKVVDQASQRVASMELPSDHLNKQLTAFGQELEKVVKRLGAIVDDVGVSAGVRRKRRWFRREKEEDRS